MARTIRLQSDSNAHDRPWRVAVEQGFFTDEGLDVVYHEDNPKGAEGRVKDFAHRWKETQLQQGALEVYPVCEWGAIERVQQLGKGKIIGLDTTVRTGAIMVRKDSSVQTLADLRNVPIAVTWHAGTFYAAIEVMEAAGVAFDEIKLEHATDRLDALLSGRNEAAAFTSAEPDTGGSPLLISQAHAMVTVTALSVGESAFTAATENGQSLLEAAAAAGDVDPSFNLASTLVRLCSVGALSAVVDQDDSQSKPQHPARSLCAGASAMPMPRSSIRRPT